MDRELFEYIEQKKRRSAAYERHNSRTDRWESPDWLLPREHVSSERKFRSGQLDIITNQYIQELGIYGFYSSVPKENYNKNVNILNENLKLWKDKQNEYTTSNYTT